MSISSIVDRFLFTYNNDISYIPFSIYTCHPAYVYNNTLSVPQHETFRRHARAHQAREASGLRACMHACVRACVRASTRRQVLIQSTHVANTCARPQECHAHLCPTRHRGMKHMSMHICKCLRACRYTCLCPFIHKAVHMSIHTGTDGCVVRRAEGVERHTTQPAFDKSENANIIDTTSCSRSS